MEFGSDISVSHKNVLDLHTFNRTLNVLVIKPVHLVSSTALSIFIGAGTMDWGNLLAPAQGRSCGTVRCI